MVENATLNCTLVQTIVVELRSEVKIVHTSVLTHVISCILSDHRFFTCSLVLYLISKFIKRTLALSPQLLDCLSLIISTCVVLHIFIININR